jgi:hypothetical protein
MDPNGTLPLLLRGTRVRVPAALEDAKAATVFEGGGPAWQSYRNQRQH